MIVTECQIIKKFNHPTIIRLYEIYQDLEAVFLLTEYISQGDLYSYIKINKKMPEK